MKKYIFILILLISNCLIFSQETKKYEFIGLLTITEKEKISYKINFKETENGKIEGESFTDFNGANSTKSKIIGIINHNENEISFTEVKNISTESSEKEEIFCFIQVENLKIKTVENKKIIQGTFTGKYSSGKKCASGNIYMVSKNLIDELKLSSDTLKKTKSNSALINKEKEIKVLNKNDKLIADWQGDQIVIDIWDGLQEDNDMINIYFNGKLIEEKLVVKNKKITIIIPFKENKGIIRILGLNEGSIAYNTVNFMLKDGSDTHSFISKVNEGEEITVELNRKKD